MTEKGCASRLLVRTHFCIGDQLPVLRAVSSRYREASPFLWETLGSALGTKGEIRESVSASAVSPVPSAQK